MWGGRCRGQCREGSGRQRAAALEGQWLPAAGAGAGAMEDGPGLRPAAWGPGGASYQQMGDLWGQG